MNPREKLEPLLTEPVQTDPPKEDKYPNFPKYCGRISGVAGTGIGFVTASGFSAVANHLCSSQGYRASKGAGIIGALVGFGIFYGAGYGAGKVAKALHVPDALEKGVDLLKKL